jgi:hypothetical protein
VEEAKCGVAVGLRQGTATEALSLLRLYAADGRIVTRRATDPGAVVAERYSEERRRASAMTLLPDLAQGGYLWLVLGIEEKDLKRWIAQTEEKASGH